MVFKILQNLSLGIQHTGLHGATSHHVAQAKTLVEEGVFVKQKKVFKQIKDSYLWDVRSLEELEKQLMIVP